MLNRSNRLGKSKNNSFARNTLILATSAVIGKLLGAIYRIPLTNILGAEGIGLYQLAFPVYALIITLSSGAIPTALASIISNRFAVEDKTSIAKIYRAACTLMLAIGGIFTVILPLLARPIALAQGNVNLQYAYYMLAPCVLIVAVANCIKGFFQGKLNMFPTALSQVVEQGVKLLAGLILSALLIKISVFHAVLGAVGAILLSEFVCLVTLAMQYFIGNKNLVKFQKPALGYYKILIKVSAPIMLVGLFFPFVQFADSLLIVNILKLTGVSNAIATAEYGILSGSVNTLINMPVMIILSVATTIVPYIARKRAERSCQALVTQVTKAVRLTNMLAIPSTVIIALLSESIINTVYPALSLSSRALSATLMSLSSLTIILLVNMQLYGAILQGLGRSKVSAYAMLIGAIGKIILDIIMIYYLGIKGAVWAGIIVYAIMLTVNYFSYRRLLGRHNLMLVDLLIFTANSIIMGGVIALITSGLKQNFLALFIGGVSGVAMYIFMTTYRYCCTKVKNDIDYHPIYKLKPIKNRGKLR